MEHENDSSRLEFYPRNNIRLSLKQFISKFSILKIFPCMQQNTDHQDHNECETHFFMHSSNQKSHTNEESCTTVSKNTDQLSLDQPLIKDIISTESTIQSSPNNFNSTVSKAPTQLYNSFQTAPSLSDQEDSFCEYEFEHQYTDDLDLSDNCPICFISYKEILMSNDRYSFKCKSKVCNHTFCSMCYRQWTLAQMKFKRHLGKCPVCLGGWVSNEVTKSVLSPVELQKFIEVNNSILSGVIRLDDQEIIDSMIEDLSIHGFVRCPGCGIAIQREGHHDDLKCWCGFRFCYVCNQSLGKGSFFRLILHHYFCKGDRSPSFFAF